MASAVASSSRGTEYGAVLPVLTSQRATSMATNLFLKWLQGPNSPTQGVSLWTERSGTRSVGLKALRQLLGNHFVGETTILKAGGFTKAAEVIVNSLPSNKKTRSGDLGELLATEYVREQTQFIVAINKLRWKSDRQTAMHGNDVVAVDSSAQPVRVLKCECKSRAAFGSAVVTEAVESLDKDGGRPNPSTLAFIAKRLYEENRDAEAHVYRDLQAKRAITPKMISHLIFVLSGNDPSSHLMATPKPKRLGIKRESVAVIIPDHGAFVKKVFS